MGIDWSQFNEGDEVAVTLVGTWHTDSEGQSSLSLPDGFRVWPSTTLAAAVDAYRIEPDYEPGDMVRDKFGHTWRINVDKRWCRVRDDDQSWQMALPVGAVRVKVVDA